MAMADGVVGRGVLLDVPRALGRHYLDSGEVVTVDDLRRTEEAQGVGVGPGDVLLVAWGREARRRAKKRFDGFSGLHAECLPWLHERDVAVLGSDGISDPMPFVATPDWPFPVHQIGITAMGLHLDRQHGPGPAGGALCRRAGAGNSSSPWPPCGSRGHGVPGQPGGGAVTAHDELRALDQRYARAADARDVAALAELFHPDAEIVGSRGAQTCDGVARDHGRAACPSRSACTCSATP